MRAAITILLGAMALGGCLQAPGTTAAIPEEGVAPGSTPGGRIFVTSVGGARSPELGSSFMVQASVHSAWQPSYSMVLSHVKPSGHIVQASAWRLPVDFDEWGPHWVYMQAFRPDGSLAGEEVVLETIETKVEWRGPCGGTRACPPLEFTIPKAPSTYNLDGVLSPMAGQPIEGRIEVRDAAGALVLSATGGSFDWPDNDLDFSSEGFAPGNWSAQWFPPAGWVGDAHVGIIPGSFAWHDQSVFDPPPGPPVDLSKLPPTPGQALHVYGWPSVIQEIDGNERRLNAGFVVQCATPDAKARDWDRLEVKVRSASGDVHDLEVAELRACQSSADAPDAANVPGNWTLEATWPNPDGPLSTTFGFRNTHRVSGWSKCGALLPEECTLDSFPVPALADIMVLVRPEAPMEGDRATITDQDGREVATHVWLDDRPWEVHLKAVEDGEWSVQYVRLQKENLVNLYVLIG